MDRQSAFSYQCNQCGRCCHNQNITLSPVDVIAIARACGIRTGSALARYTMRRGSLLRFEASGACIALDGVRCSIHRGRPLACRLYPLGLERDGAGAQAVPRERNAVRDRALARDRTPEQEEPPERDKPLEKDRALRREGARERDGEREHFVQLEGAPGSAGAFGVDGTVTEFLAAQDVEERLALNERYRPLLATMGRRVAELMNFEIVEPREFWRLAVAEALRETNFDNNRIIDAVFDTDGACAALVAGGDRDEVGVICESERDGAGGPRESIRTTVEAHLSVLGEIVHRETDAMTIATAAVLLAVSLGYSPAEAMAGAGCACG